MDGYSGYNHIYIAKHGVHKTTFRCPGSIGNFEWIVMSFGLKNTVVMYQRTMNGIFHDMIGQFMQIYINDVVVKSNTDDNHLADLEKPTKE